MDVGEDFALSGITGYHGDIVGEHPVLFNCALLPFHACLCTYFLVWDVAS